MIIGEPSAGEQWLRGGRLPPGALYGESGRVVARNGKAEYGIAWGIKRRRGRGKLQRARRFLEWITVVGRYRMVLRLLGLAAFEFFVDQVQTHVRR